MSDEQIERICRVERAIADARARVHELRRLGVCMACRRVRVLEAYRTICDRCNTARATA